jgi:hypothetical protein
MNLRFVSLLALSCSVAAQGVEIYSNAPLVSLPTGGFGGNPASILQARSRADRRSANNTFGYGAQVGVSNSLADDFAVNGTWLVDGIEVFGYVDGRHRAGLHRRTRGDLRQPARHGWRPDRG